MFVLKTILSSLLWALLVLFIPIFGLEVVSQSSFGIGSSKFFLRAVIYLTIFFSLATTLKYTSQCKCLLHLFFASLLFWLVPVVIQIAVTGAAVIRPLTTTIYWLAALSIVLALIPYIAGLFFSKICNDNVARVMSAILACICIGIPAILSIVFFAYYLISNSVLSADTLLAIVQTNNNEAHAYLRNLCEIRICLPNHL